MRRDIASAWAAATTTARWRYLMAALMLPASAFRSARVRIAEDCNAAHAQRGTCVSMPSSLRPDDLSLRRELWPARNRSQGRKTSPLAGIFPTVVYTQTPVYPDTETKTMATKKAAKNCEEDQEEGCKEKALEMRVGVRPERVSRRSSKEEIRDDQCPPLAGTFFAVPGLQSGNFPSNCPIANPVPLRWP